MKRVLAVTGTTFAVTFALVGVYLAGVAQGISAVKPDILTVEEVKAPGPKAAPPTIYCGSYTQANTDGSNGCELLPGYQTLIEEGPVYVEVPIEVIKYKTEYVEVEVPVEVPTLPMFFEDGSYRFEGAPAGSGGCAPSALCDDTDNR